MTNTTLTKVVPVFVAIMVWLIRVLIIGTFSIAGERIFSQAETRVPQRTNHPILQPASALVSHQRPPVSAPFRPASKVARPESTYSHPEPTYHNISMNTKAAREAEYIDTPRHS